MINTLSLLTQDGTKLALSVTSFSYQAQIGQASSMQLRVFCDQELAALVPKQAAQFEYSNYAGTTLYYYHGILRQFSCQYDPIKKRYDYCFYLASHIARLEDSRLIRLYDQTSVQNIIAAVLAPITSAYAMSFEVCDYLDQSNLIQPLDRLEISYHHHDYAYLCVLQNYGLRFYSVMTEDKEQLIIINQPEQFSWHQETLMVRGWDNIAKFEDQPAGFYDLSYQSELLPDVGYGRYYDWRKPDTSWDNLTSTSKLFSYEEPYYFPIEQQNQVNSQINNSMQTQSQITILKGYYSGAEVGERVSFQDLSGQTQQGFIEKKELVGHFVSDKWYFETTLFIRPYSLGGAWLDAIRPRLALPGMVMGAFIDGSSHIDEEGRFSVNFPKSFATDATDSLSTSVRDIQETVTQGGGSSHGSLAAGEVVLLSQNGLTYDWLLLGSLDNAVIPSGVTQLNSHQHRIDTVGGVHLHMNHKESDGMSSELQLMVNNDEDAKSGINLGTIGDRLAANPEDHGLTMQSTGFAKTVVQNNYLKVVGDPNNPSYYHQVLHSTDEENNTAVSESQTSAANYHRETYGTMKPSLSPVLSEEDKFNIFVATVYGEASSSMYVSYEGVNYYASTVMASQAENLQAIVTAWNTGKYKRNIDPLVKYAQQFNQSVIVTPEMVRHYHKAAVISDAAWQAVASVIINRAGQHHWAKCKNGYDVITYGGIDAYTNPIKYNFKNPTDYRRTKAHLNFLLAYAYLENIKLDEAKYAALGCPGSVNQALVDKMRQTLQPIYQGQAPVALAYKNLFYYISPLAEISLDKVLYNSGSVPVFCYPMVSVSTLQETDDFTFFSY